MTNTVNDVYEMAYRKFIADCRLWKPNAMLLTGDIGGSVSGSNPCIKAWLMARTGLVPVYYANGNHEPFEDVKGTPSMGPLEQINAFNMTYPFLKTAQISSGDGSFKIRMIVLDWNYYNDTGADQIAEHTTGDYIGHHADYVGLSFKRQYGSAQLAWVQSVLAADTTSNAIAIMTHGPSINNNFVADDLSLGDLLYADGRPAIGFGGHFHPDGSLWTQKRTGGSDVCTIYKCPAMQESKSWTRVSLSWTGSAIAIDEMAVKNYTNPGGWTLNSPFVEG